MNPFFWKNGIIEQGKVSNLVGYSQSLNLSGWLFSGNGETTTEFGGCFDKLFIRFSVTMGNGQ